MKTYDQVGERIRERLLLLKYVRDDGEPDVQRFCWDHRFDKTNVYNWLNERITPFKDLIRLCIALQCSAEWLLTGVERGKAKPRQGRGRVQSLLLGLVAAGGLALWPSPGVAAPAHTLAVGLRANLVHLIGRWRRSRRDSGYFVPGIAYA